MLVSEISMLCGKLTKSLENADEKDYYFANPIPLIKKVSDYIVKTNSVKERIGDAIMGGKVLKLWSEELLEQGMAEGKAEGMAEGKAEGMAEGMAEGQNKLVQAIQRLKNGESAEVILASGIDQKTVELAKACL